MSNKLVEVYKSPTEMEAQIIKGILESNEIPCFLRSNVGTSPFGITMGDTKVMVWESMAEEARELIEGDADV